MEIGFVLKYNEITGRGIIVFGHSGPFRRSPEPVVYLRDECPEEVSPGMFVYFDYTINNRNERLATNIEIASLCNFKRDIVIRTFSQSRYVEYYLRNRDIERLLDDPMEESACYDERWDLDTNDDVLEDLDILDLENDTISDATSLLPSIIEKTWDGSYLINISNLSLWLNESLACKESCYGKTLAEFLPLYGDRFEIIEDRDNADYVYSAEKLCNLPGRHLSSKRNHIKHFERNGAWELLVVKDGEHMDEARAFVDEFYKEKNDPELAEEAMAIDEMFRNYEELGFLGGLLYQNGRPVAFTAGTRLGEEVFDTHFEKAMPGVEGAYTMINREFARLVCTEYPEIKYFNREEDMGIEGLRKAKESYHPDILLMKYYAKEK